jgi:hypothetical protein
MIIVKVKAIGPHWNTLSEGLKQAAPNQTRLDDKVVCARVCGGGECVYVCACGVCVCVRVVSVCVCVVCVCACGVCVCVCVVEVSECVCVCDCNSVKSA